MCACAAAVLLHTAKRYRLEDVHVCHEGSYFVGFGALCASL